MGDWEAVIIMKIMRMSIMIIIFCGDDDGTECTQQGDGVSTLSSPLHDGCSDGREAGVLGHPGSSVSLVVGEGGCSTSTQQQLHHASITKPCCMDQGRHATLTLTAK